MGQRISLAILAILATAVIACGGTSAGATGRSDAGSDAGQAGDFYLTSDQGYGVNGPVEQSIPAAGGGDLDGGSGIHLQP